MSIPVNAWYSAPPPAAEAGILLLCFPYAGGGTWIYREWVRQLSPQIAVLPIRLPARAERFREPAATNLRQLAQDIAASVADALARPFAVFGHSMGAWMAYEFVRALERHGRCPARLIVSAAPAPSRKPRRVPIHGLPDPELVKAVQSRYGHPYLKDPDPEILALLLPALRGDMAMFETYAAEPSQSVSCPVSVFVGRGDPLPRPDLLAWAEHASVPPEFREFDGGHFYLHEQEKALIEAVRRLLVP